MEAATKKKRGRPAQFKDGLYTIYYDKEKRTAQNLYFAGKGYDLLGDAYQSFFFTEKGKWKRQGIAEQIGRMYEQDQFKKEDCVTIGETAVKLIEKGWKVKSIERWIRNGRKTGEW